MMSHRSRVTSQPWLWLGVGIGLVVPELCAQEFRALWVDTWHAAMRNSTEVAQLVADARRGNFNAVVVEVRKRGDAYYNSRFEPKATDISPPSYDPLADLIARAHNTASGPRIEVHAWIVTYPIWRNKETLPSQSDHPFRLHPDWLTESEGGATWDGHNYAFDPGHPAVQEHTFNVAMDIVERYDVDGFHFDYIRYTGRDWGYHPWAVERFQYFYGRSERPSVTDPEWLQFRREQVTALVRKVYLSAIAIKPWVKISAATITWAPGPATDADWTSSAAYSSVLQDWRAWMEEGILDVNLPMAYFRQETHADAWDRWTRFAKDHRYNRHLAVGAGVYLNTISNSIVQLRSTRNPTARGHRADGVAGYSYAAPTSESLSRGTFLDALTQPSAYDPQPVPLFATAVDPPLMPWKEAPVRGHLAGYVIDAEANRVADGAALLLSGQITRGLVADATGFYGSVGLPPGSYWLRAEYAELEPQTVLVTIAAGEVTRQDFSLGLPAHETFFVDLRVSPGERQALLSWKTTAPAACRIEYGPAAGEYVEGPWDDPAQTRHEVLLAGLSPNAIYFFRLTAADSANTIQTPDYSFRTAGEIVIDNPQATFTGVWKTNSSAPGKYLMNFHFTDTVAGDATHTATFAPAINTPGRYDVHTWYPEGGNLTTAAPFAVHSNDGVTAVTVNQTAGGGGWRALALDRHFLRGSGGYVRLANNSGETGKLVVADAVRFAYVSGQDHPASGAVPEWWADHYFGGPVDGVADPDQDGYSNHAEYVLGTAPDDPASRLELAILPGPESGIEVFFWPFPAGRTYWLEERADLSAGAWTRVDHPEPRLHESGHGVIALPSGETHRFYRLEAALCP